jgi:hypothetical protein
MIITLFIVIIMILKFHSCSYEGNKATAKDSNQSAGTRVGAAMDAVGDKANETGHAASKEAHKQKAAH